MMTRSVLLMLLVAVTLGTGGTPVEAAAAARAKVRADRPRIFLHADELAGWRERLAAVPELKSTYEATRAWAEGVREPSENGYVSSMELQEMALIYLAENRAKGALGRVKQWMEFFAAELRDDHWSHPLITRALAVAYDWCYPDLTPAERKRYGETLVRYAEATLGYAQHELPANATWSNQVSDYFNQFYWHHGQVPFAGLALAGEAGFEEAAAKYLVQGDEWLHRHMLPATNQAGAGGGWFESLGYNTMTAPPFAELLEGWRTATGEDLFPQSTWLPGNLAWVQHSLIPHSGDYLPFDDIHWPSGGPSSGNGSVGELACILSARYGDPFGQRFARTLYPSEYPQWNFPFLVWYQPGRPEVDLAATDKGRWFPGLGQVNMRTGWGVDDTLAVYRAGRVYGGHGHYSPGHFLFYRKGNLLVEDGYYGSHAPASHNTLSIGGEMRSLAHQTPQHYLAQMDGTTYDYGRITGYYHDAEFARYHWVDSDLTRAYTPEQATSVTRRFVFLPPRTVLVLDAIRGPEGVEKRFRLHAPSEPQIEEKERRASWTGGDGKLYVTTLSAVGSFQFDAAKGNESHRYTVTRAEPWAEDEWAHVLYAADLEEGPAQVGLQALGGHRAITVDTPEAMWVVVFSAKGEKGTRVSYEAPQPSGQGRPVRHLVADLEGRRFLVSHAGRFDNQTATADGMVFFETAEGGRFTVAARRAR